LVRCIESFVYSLFQREITLTLLRTLFVRKPSNNYQQDQQRVSLEIREKIKLKDSIRNLGFKINNNKEKINCPYCGRELGDLNENEAYCCCNRLFFLEKNKQKTLDQYLTKQRIRRTN